MNCFRLSGRPLLTSHNKGDVDEEDKDVLEALQYANVGQGILAGFAILFCAMILDRIVQGARK